MSDDVRYKLGDNVREDLADIIYRVAEEMGPPPTIERIKEILEHYPGDEAMDEQRADPAKLAEAIATIDSHASDRVHFHTPQKYWCKKHGAQSTRCMTFTWASDDGVMEKVINYCFDCYHDLVKEHCFELEVVHPDTEEEEQ